MRVELFGTTYNSPIFLCPTGGEKSFFADGELAVARAAKARGTLQILSTATSTGVEDVNKALGRPVWYQLYAPSSWEACEKILRRVEAAGCPVIALTVDNTTGRNSETYLRTRPKDLQPVRRLPRRRAGPDHQGTADVRRHRHDRRARRRIPRWTGPSSIACANSGRGSSSSRGSTRARTRGCAVEHGIDGILVSNHGGRSTETLRPTIEALPEVVAEVGNRIPVFVDGGFRRGTDVFKALALGAKAVGIGRPFLWGLGAFGQAGVDRVLEILQGELKLAMGNCGTRTVADITRAYVATPDWKS